MSLKKGRFEERAWKKRSLKQKETRSSKERNKYWERKKGEERERRRWREKAKDCKENTKRREQKQRRKKQKTRRRRRRRRRRRNRRTTTRKKWKKMVLGEKKPQTLQNCGKRTLFLSLQQKQEKKWAKQKTTEITQKEQKANLSSKMPFLTLRKIFLKPPKLEKMFKNGHISKPWKPRFWTKEMSAYFWENFANFLNSFVSS